MITLFPATATLGIRKMGTRDDEYVFWTSHCYAVGCGQVVGFNNYSDACNYMQKHGLSHDDWYPYTFRAASEDGAGQYAEVNMELVRDALEDAYHYHAEGVRTDIAPSGVSWLMRDHAVWMYLMVLFGAECYFAITIYCAAGYVLAFVLAVLMAFCGFKAQRALAGGGEKYG